MGTAKTVDNRDEVSYTEIIGAGQSASLGYVWLGPSRLLPRRDLKEQVRGARSSRPR